MDKNRVAPCLLAGGAPAPGILFFIFCLVFLPSCSSTDIKREIRVPAEAKEIKSEMPDSSRPKTPDFLPVAEDISPLKSRIVDIKARNNLLRDVLHLIAEATGMNLVMQKGVNPDTPVTLTLRNVTAEDALNTIFTSVDYFYAVKDNMLIVKAVDTRIFELGHPAIVQTYSVDVGGDILGAAAAGTTGAAGGATGISSLKGSITQSQKGDQSAFGFWDAIEKSITSILAASTPAAQAPNAPAFQPVQGSFTVNRLTGTIMVTAAKNDIARVEQYINTIKKVINRQVLVEAKIIDVQLSESLQYGIDWAALDLNNLGKITLGTSKFSDPIGATTPSFQIGVSRWNFTGLLKAIQDQGEVRILSNPRVNIMNGQTALLSVGRNTTYISSVVATTNIANGVQQTTYTTTPGSTLSGIIIGIVPYINENGEISMTITPIISDLVRLDQTTFGQTGSQTTLSLPTVDLKELSTTVKVRDGQMVVIGGLISKKENLTGSDVPGAGNIPVVGGLFKSRNKQESRSELVIVLQPVLVSR